MDALALGTVPAWEREKKRLHCYSRRHPESTGLYQIVYNCRDEFERSWEQMFQHQYGALRSEVLKALDRYLDCGILAHGCARAHCAECNHSELIAFSCKRRCLCPSCDAKRAYLFAEHLEEKVLLKLPHRHGVFTIPKRLRPYFKFNRSLTKHLYRSAWQSWQELVLAECPDGSPGAIMALHTAGDLFAFHPHIHGLFLAGALFVDGTFRELTIDTEKLQQLFSDKVFGALVDQELLSLETVQSMRNWPHSGFQVFLGEPIPSADIKQRLFTARYLKKCPISNQRLKLVQENGETTVSYSAKRNGVRETRIFVPLQFLAEVQQHIPDTFEQTTRYYGCYSARSRGAAREQGTPNSQFHLPEPTNKASPTWAVLMKKVFEIDPLICPKCGASMSIKAFITDYREVQRLASNLGLTTWRAPPSIQYSLPEAA